MFIIKVCARCGNRQRAKKGGYNSSICDNCGGRNLWLDDQLKIGDFCGN